MPRVGVPLFPTILISYYNYSPPYVLLRSRGNLVKSGNTSLFVFKEDFTVPY